jgi:valyl-tRNA synthetase
VRCGAAVSEDFRQLAPFIRTLATVGKLEAGPDVARPPQAAGHVTPDFEAYVSLEGLRDVAAERAKLEKQLAEKQRALQAAEAKLANPGFVAKAKPEAVQQQRDLVADLKRQIAAIEANLEELRGQ